MKIKQLSGDFFFTCGAQVVLNAVQHLLIFPWINKVSGPEAAGHILACLSLVFIFAITFGTGINNVRLVEERKNTGSNGDYIGVILAGGLFLFLTVLIAKFIGFNPRVPLGWFFLINFLMMIRAYGDCDFQIKLHFSSYFLYYCIISLGYVLGTFIYFKTNNWTHIFIPGELAAIIILLLRRFILKFSLPSDKFLYLLKAVFFLFLSTAMMQLVVSGDRLILKYFLGDRTVAAYASLSLAANTANLIFIPLATLLLSYLTAKTIPLNRRILGKVSLIWLGISLTVFIVTVITSPIYVKLFYPNLYDEIVNLNILVNFGLILACFGLLYRSYIIATASTTVVFVFEFTFTFLYLVLSILLTKEYGVLGYAWAVVISRFLRAVIGGILIWLYI